MAMQPALHAPLFQFEMGVTGLRSQEEAASIDDISPIAHMSSPAVNEGRITSEMLTLLSHDDAFEALVRPDALTNRSTQVKIEPLPSQEPARVRRIAPCTTSPGPPGLFEQVFASCASPEVPSRPCVETLLPPGPLPATPAQDRKLPEHHGHSSQAVTKLRFQVTLPRSQATPCRAGRRLHRVTVAKSSPWHCRAQMLCKEELGPPDAFTMPWPKWVKLSPKKHPPQGKRVRFRLRRKTTIVSGMDTNVAAPVVPSIVCSNSYHLSATGSAAVAKNSTSIFAFAPTSKFASDQVASVAPSSASVLACSFADVSDTSASSLAACPAPPTCGFHGKGTVRPLKEDPEMAQLRAALRHTLCPKQRGQLVAVVGDGWGHGRGGYEAIVTESDELTFTVVRVSGEEAWTETHVLKEFCIPVGHATATLNISPPGAPARKKPRLKV